MTATQRMLTTNSKEIQMGTIGVHPHIAGEFEAGALMTVVAADGLGLMPMAAVVKKELSRYQLENIGTMKNCNDQFYAISNECHLTHPVVVVVTESAQRKMFG